MEVAESIRTRVKEKSVIFRKIYILEKRINNTYIEERMLYALDLKSNKLISASKGARCICPTCRETVIPKCGQHVIYHFAHKSINSLCSNKYHDKKSEWHYNWQLQIENPQPGINIEVPTWARDWSSYKVADLKPLHGVIIEFQKSPMPTEERFDRERVYKRMIWVLHNDIYKNKVWKETSRHNIPIFVDMCDGTLESGSLLNGIISKENFIKRFINSRNIDYMELKPGYWGIICKSFLFYNSIIWNLYSEEREKERIKRSEWASDRYKRREKLKSKLRKERKEKREYERKQKLWGEERRKQREKELQEEDERLEREEKREVYLQKDWLNKELLIRDVRAYRHYKYDVPDSLELIFDLVEFTYGPKTLEWNLVHDVTIYLALNSTNEYARRKSMQIIKDLGGIANNVDDAISECPYWDKVYSIIVKADGKYIRVLKIITYKTMETQKAVEENLERARELFRLRKTNK